ncbi:hypothetical protein N9F12_01305 [Burkholderiaceae bacterium]|nr:hypothetical protein [Burkholderiaceae bacterium]
MNEFFTPTCLDDFIFSNTAERFKLEVILSRKFPFPSAGKSGILLHGTWGTGKSTLSRLLPCLLETAYLNTWSAAAGIGQMPAHDASSTDSVKFACGGGLSSVQIAKDIEALTSHLQITNASRHDYFIFDEIDGLTQPAQKSLRSKMDLPRSMYFLSTNYLSKVDQGVINRCHLVEMNQATSLQTYVPLGNSVLRKMQVPEGAVDAATLMGIAKTARGSMRSYITEVGFAGLANGGAVPA